MKQAESADSEAGWSSSCPNIILFQARAAAKVCQKTEYHNMLVVPTKTVFA